MKLYSTISGMERVLAISLINNHLGFAFEKPNMVFAHKLCVLPFQSFKKFSVLQSTIHYSWAWNYSSTNLSLLNYSPSDCFETFPFPRFPTPESRTPLEVIGERYYQHRQSIMQTRQEGLTKTYNRFHNPAEAAHREVLDRLLELNHQRYAEEVAAGLHDKKANKPAAKRDPNPAPTGATPQVDMFGHAQLDVFDTPDVERKAEDKMRRNYAASSPPAGIWFIKEVPKPRS